MLSVVVLGVFLLGVGCAEFLHAGFHYAGISFCHYDENRYRSCVVIMMSSSFLHSGCHYDEFRHFGVIMLSIFTLGKVMKLSL